MMQNTTLEEYTHAGFVDGTRALLTLNLCLHVKIFVVSLAATGSSSEWSIALASCMAIV